ncbi:MAG: CoA transferase, partial [Dehalococcoidales bacterium]|nr:CoA transferase [Dehalococcoidales bacterium]
NRNKLGITLNLNQPKGIALARKLVKISDAVVENFAPRVMANWGLDYPNLAKIKPDIIMLSMPALGQTGPRRNYTGFAPTIHAFSGMTYLTSFPGRPPTGPGFAYADHVAGLVASLSLLGALEYRRRTGEGQHIDVSQTEAVAGLMGDAILDYSASGNEPEPAGNSSPQAAPHNAYRCKGDDRWCAVAVFGNGEWQAFKRTLGNPDWAREKRFATLAGRLKNSEELDRLISAWTVERTAEEVMAIFQGQGISSGVVNDANDLAHNPQLKARGFFVELEHPELGRTIADASPIRLSDTPARYRRASPTRGQDNDYVYGELLGLSAEEITGLKRDGVL